MCSRGAVTVHFGVHGHHHALHGSRTRVLIFCMRGYFSVTSFVLFGVVYFLCFSLSGQLHEVWIPSISFLLGGRGSLDFCPQHFTTSAPGQVSSPTAFFVFVFRERSEAPALLSCLISFNSMAPPCLRIIFRPLFSLHSLPANEKALRKRAAQSFKRFRVPLTPSMLHRA